MSRRDEPLLQVPASMPPPEPRRGDMYFDQDGGELMMFDGSEWLPVGDVAPVPAPDLSPAEPEDQGEVDQEQLERTRREVERLG